MLLSQKNKSIQLWGHKTGHIQNLLDSRENKKYLPGITLPSTLHPTNNLEQAVEGATTIVMVVPSQSYRKVFKKIAPFLHTNSTVISAAKGIENTTLKTMTQVMDEVISKKRSNLKGIELGVLSGPSFAEEVARGMPTAVTVGCINLQTAKEIQQLFATDFFRVYASEDVIGLEISSALKNVIAIAAGISDGLSYGLNARAALITRGLKEIKGLGIKLGAKTATFSGLSGLGDLLLTCTGHLSRNRTVGLALGAGKTLAQIKGEMSMVAEGIKTTQSGYSLAKQLRVEMPITEQVYKIIYKNKTCSEAVKYLFRRQLRVE